MSLSNVLVRTRREGLLALVSQHRGESSLSVWCLAPRPPHDVFLLSCVQLGYARDIICGERVRSLLCNFLF